MRSAPPASSGFSALPCDAAGQVEGVSSSRARQSGLKSGSICRYSQAGINSLVSPSPQNRAVSGLVRGLCTFINQLIEKQYFR